MMSDTLLDHHRALLVARAVSVEVARARGYSSTVDADWLRGEGFTRAVARLGHGLVIPLHDVRGTRAHVVFRPDRPRVRDGRPVKYETPPDARQVIDVPPLVYPLLGDPAVPLWITESPVKADAAVSAGLCAVGTNGVYGWRGRNRRGGRTALPDLEDVALRGRTVYLVPDSDVAINASVANAVARLGALLEARGADVFYVTLPAGNGGRKTGLDDFLATVGAAHDLLELAGDEPPTARGTSASRRSKTNEEPSPLPGVTFLRKPCPLAEVETTVRRWLRMNDMRPLRAVLAAALATRLPGDPVWLLVVAAASSAKTELLSPLFGLDWVHPAGAITEAALLSGTSDKDRAKDATGGLLRQVGPRGLLVCKDFGSVLSMHRDTRARTLAALREVYDGRWDRPVGVDGARVLHWHGHCGLLGGTTPAIDRYHAVLALLGDRFVMIRIRESDNPIADAETALRHAYGGHEQDMRAQIAEAVQGLLTHTDAAAPPPTADAETATRLAQLAVFTARARTPTDRDSYNGDLLSLPAVEGPGRLVVQYARLHGAATLLGDPDPLGTVRRVAADSMPATRARLALELLAASAPQATSAIARTLGMPTKTTSRYLDDLAVLGLANRGKRGDHDTAANDWDATDWLASYDDVLRSGACAEMSPRGARDDSPPS